MYGAALRYKFDLFHRHIAMQSTQLKSSFSIETNVNANNMFCPPAQNNTKFWSCVLLKFENRTPVEKKTIKENAQN